MAAEGEAQLQEARDRTLYWTLSFYIDAGPLGAKRACAANAATQDLRDAIDPLFNDIADRSRLGVVEDELFAAAERETLTLRLPEEVRWMTEGCHFSVPIAEAQRARSVNLRRFFYRHGNGAISWHLSFDYHYAGDLAAEAPGTAPATYYFLSLIQKLSWPKEFRVSDECGSTDALVGITVDGTTQEGPDTADKAGQGFWAFVEACFARDYLLLGDKYEGCSGQRFADLFSPRASIEVPGLDYHDCRSLFFIHDKAFFDLIQPVEDGTLVKRRKRVLDSDFQRYPELIETQKKAQGRRAVILGDEYWAEARPVDDPDAGSQLAYLFLAGFNQNIIDFMNQEASEVLDSLDPIYPNSDEQEEEGFFVRYANPRSMITYVRRSRTLEVGNDHIGTCPYAFLIHALSMHNEALTRAQEKATFAAIETTGALIAAHDYGGAEDVINAVRHDAFETYDRHRYINPFRYDTEREVFDALEQLRGTSRLKQAYEAALRSLEEQAQDLDSRREADHDRRVALLFGVLGVSGVIQVAYQVDQYVREREGNLLNWLLGIGYVAVPVIAGIAICFRFLRAPQH